MNIAYVLVQSTIGHEMEVLNNLLKINLVTYFFSSLLISGELIKYFIKIENNL